MARTRKSKLTKELSEEFLKAYSIGLTIEKCCQYVGIDEKTYYNWAKRSSDPRYFQFFQSIKKVESQVQIILLNDLRNSADWRAKAWVLERRFCKEWGKPKEFLEIETIDKTKPLSKEEIIKELENRGLPTKLFDE